MDGVVVLKLVLGETRSVVTTPDVASKLAQEGGGARPKDHAYTLETTYLYHILEGCPIRQPCLRC